MITRAGRDAPCTARAYDRRLLGAGESHGEGALTGPARDGPLWRSLSPELPVLGDWTASSTARRLEPHRAEVFERAELLWLVAYLAMMSMRPGVRFPRMEAYVAALVATLEGAVGACAVKPHSVLG